jgi:hypothetical protein
VFVKQGLVLLVPCTEVLQELVGQFHDLLHTHILPLETTPTMKGWRAQKHTSTNTPTQTQYLLIGDLQ